MKNFFSSIIRIYFHAVWVFCSLIGLLAYVPFTFRQVLGINLLPWLTKLISFQPLLMVTSVIFLSIALVACDKMLNETRAKNKIKFFTFLVIAIVITILRIRTQLANDWTSLAFSFASLVPSFLLSFFDLRTAPEFKTKPESSWVFIFCGLMAAFVAAVLMSYFYEPQFHFLHFVPAFSLAVLIASILALVEQMTNRFELRLQVRYTLFGIAVGLLISFFMFYKVSSAISFYGNSALGWSFAFGCTIGMALISFAAGLTRKSDEIPRTAFFLLFNSYIGGRFIFILYAGVWIFLAYLTATYLPSVDWNGLIQQLAAGFLFTTAFLGFYFVTSFIILDTQIRSIMKAVTVGLAFFFLATLFAKSNTIRLEESVDPLFLLAKNVVLPTNSSDEFYKFIQQRTNLSNSIKIDLAEVPLGERRTSNVFEKPLIFIFVIDSLRRDYIAPYNSDVHFTPQIQDFSKESIVFLNAFTRFGATGLSEPSIWAGRMIPHQMYPKNFSRINTLEKLTVQENYLVWLSRDSILKEILSSADFTQDLDVGVGTQDLDFCQTSKEVLERLKTAHPEQPIFVYSQPQNLHVSVLARKKSVLNPLPQKTYAPFNAVYSEALERVDGCFGHFIQELKKIGVFEKSIVILTSDHGDSLGDEGRYGHAYTVFPEIMRIPLLIHVPDEMKTSIQTDTERLIFSTDIAPSLEFLLGRTSKQIHWSQGQSFFWGVNETPSAKLEKEHLVFSSYGPVAGIISGAGNSIYISDGVNFVDYFYQINKKGASNLGVSPGLKTENESIIREKTLDLFNFYHIHL